MNTPIWVKKLRDTAILPEQASLSAIGYDIHACLENDMLVMARDRVMVPTGISIKIPHGHYGRIAPRSGLAAKHGIDVLAGVIDPDYTGEVQVILYNTSDTNFIVKNGDRIAQLICEQASSPPVREILEMPKTARGSGGFGSTGI